MREHVFRPEWTEDERRRYAILVESVLLALNLGMVAPQKANVVINAIMRVRGMGPMPGTAPREGEVLERRDLAAIRSLRETLFEICQSLDAIEALIDKARSPEEWAAADEARKEEARQRLSSTRFGSNPNLFGGPGGMFGL